MVVFSGSVALLGDTLHNAADALTAVPLAVAFVLGRRPPTRRYTYGYGRAEDLAGVVIVLIIAASSALAAYEAVDPAAPSAAGDVTCRGGGRRAWSASPATSWSPATGSASAARSAPPRWSLTGCTPVPTGSPRWPSCWASAASRSAGTGPTRSSAWSITVAILAVLRQAAREVYRRLMDAVDPALVDQAEQALRAVPGVLDVGQVRLRWIGHQLRAECEIVVDARRHRRPGPRDHRRRRARPAPRAAPAVGRPGPRRPAALPGHRLPRDPRPAPVRRARHRYPEPEAPVPRRCLSRQSA